MINQRSVLNIKNSNPSNDVEVISRLGSGIKRITDDGFLVVDRPGVYEVRYTDGAIPTVDIKLKNGRQAERQLKTSTNKTFSDILRSITNVTSALTPSRESINVKVTSACDVCQNVPVPVQPIFVTTAINMTITVIGIITNHLITHVNDHAGIVADAVDSERLHYKNIQTITLTFILMTI